MKKSYWIVGIVVIAAVVGGVIFRGNLRSLAITLNLSQASSIEEPLPEPLPSIEPSLDYQAVTEANQAILKTLATPQQDQPQAMPQTAGDTITTILNNRKAAIERLLEKDPNAVLVSMLPATVIAQLPTSIQGLIEKPITLPDAQLQVMHTDTMQNGDANTVDAHFEYFVTAEDKKYGLYLAGKEAPLTSGTRVRLTGYEVVPGKILTSSAQANLAVLSTPAPESVGPQKTLFVLVNFPDSEPNPFTKEEAENILFKGPMQAFYKEQSYDQVRFEGTVAGWYTLQRNGNIYDTMGYGNCQWPQFDSQPDNEVYAPLKRDGIDVFAYDRLVIIANHPCMGGGFSSVGKWKVFIDGVSHQMSMAWVGGNHWVITQSQHPFQWSYFDFVLAHELGHSLGVWHANGWECGEGKIHYGKRCAHQEYGNYYDTMGFGNASLHFNAYLKDVLGWLGGGHMATITKSGKYTLMPLESTTGVRAIKLSPPGMENAPYYVEYRQPIGFDAGLARPEYSKNIKGVFINAISRVFGRSSRLLDMTPLYGSTKTPTFVDDWLDVSLQEGNQYRDWGNGIFIKEVRENSKGEMKISIAVIRPECKRVAPLINVYAEPLTPKGTFLVKPGDILTYGWTIQNQDTQACGTTRIRTRVEVPVGWIGTSGMWSQTENSPNITLPAGVEADGYGWTRIDVPLDAKPGSYDASIFVLNADKGTRAEHKLHYVIEPAPTVSPTPSDRPTPTTSPKPR